MFRDAVEAIEEGQVVGLPTDTVYGLAIDPLNDEAVALLFNLKGRPEGKPIGILAANVDHAAMIGDLDGVAGELARKHWPGGLTLVVTPNVILSGWVGNTQLRTVGIRVPDHEIAQQFLTITGPLAVTSANLSGQPEAMDHEQAEAIFGNDVAAYIQGNAPGGVASTVVDATGYPPTVLRQGAVEI
jgi:L-threonylcarbamoyladenylate synthase